MSSEKPPSPSKQGAPDTDFRALVEDAVQGVLIHRNFRPLYANQSCARLFGFASCADFTAQPILRPLIPPENWPRVETNYHALIRGENVPPVGRERLLTRDGEEIWVYVTQRAIRWQGAPAVQITLLDVSHQARAEQHLAAAEQRLRAILEVLPYPVLIARQDDEQVLFVNRKACLLFAQSAGQILRMKLGDFFAAEDERKNFTRMLGKIRDVHEMETQLRTLADHDFTAEVAAIALDFGGQPAVVVALNDITERKRLEAELFHQASTDALTGVNNRRYFLIKGEQELRRVRRFGRDLAVMMLDIDHFKTINDTYGHAVGDVVIQEVMKCCREDLRQTDILGRLGGEEFAVLMPETSLRAAIDTAERLRAHIAGRRISVDGQTLSCTVSIGLAQFHADDAAMEPLLNRADQALYTAKRGGRNQVKSIA